MVGSGVGEVVDSGLGIVVGSCVGEVGDLKGRTIGIVETQFPESFVVVPSTSS